MANIIEIGQAEAGQKLLHFLERRLGFLRADIYRWLRTGQIRVNGGRAQPERRLESGDVLRLPPQAGSINARPLGSCDLKQGDLGLDLPIIFQDESLLVLDKPSGLPVQSGTGHNDSISSRLMAACASGAYVPAPAHRLDLYASGLLLVGKTHERQAWLHELFRSAKAELEREYICWVMGNAMELFEQKSLCTDFLYVETGLDGRERMAALPEGEEKPETKEAKAIFRCLETRMHQRLGKISLVWARLLTGRKHQIRVQLSSRALPLLGDWRYGGPEAMPLMLHSTRLSLPPFGADDDVLNFSSRPQWPGLFDIEDVYG